MEMAQGFLLKWDPVQSNVLREYYAKSLGTWDHGSRVGQKWKRFKPAMVFSPPKILHWISWQRRLLINGIHDERTKVNDSNSAWITYSKECRSIYNGKKHLHNSISPDVGLRLNTVPDNNVLCKRLLKISTFSVIPSCIWIIHVCLHATNKGDHTSCNPTHHKSFPYSVDLKGCNWTKMKNCTCHIYKRAVTLRFLVPQSNMHVVMLGGAPPWSKILWLWPLTSHLVCIKRSAQIVTPCREGNRKLPS